MQSSLLNNLHPGQFKVQISGEKHKYYKLDDLSLTNFVQLWGRGPDQRDYWVSTNTAILIHIRQGKNDTIIEMTGCRSHYTAFCADN